MTPRHSNSLRSHIGPVDERIKARATKQHSNTMDKHSSCWDAFCVAHNVDPYRSTWEDPVPMLQVSSERYRDGRLAHHHTPIKVITAKDGLCVMGQAHTQLGDPYPHRDSNGGIDFRIQSQIKAYKKYYAPPKRVNSPNNYHHLCRSPSVGDTRSEEEMTIADMLIITFFFLLHPGEYTGMVSDDVSFKMLNVGLFIQGCKLDLFTESAVEVKSATSAAYIFSTQENGNRNNKLVQGLSETPDAAL
jgi:hypothetical protein